MDEHVENAAENTRESIGGILLLARTEANLSQEDIAKRLYLSKTFIQYIENDEFDLLQQSPVYVRGYIRSYARLVNFSEDKIVQLLDTSGIQDVPKVTRSYISTRMQITARDKKVRIVTYGIIILILVLTFTWWHSRVSEHSEEKALAPMSAQTQPVQPTVDAPVTTDAPTADRVAKIKSQLKMDNGNA